MVAKIRNKARRLNSLKVWSAITGAALTVALILSLTPISVTITREGILAIGLSYASANPGDEIVDLRTQQTKTWYLGNDTYKTWGSLGPVHYQDNGWKEIDNAWVASSVQPWNYEMTKDDYQAYAYRLFNWGQIMKFECSNSSVSFQPKDLQWTNALSQIETISIPQSVNASVNNQPVELLTGMNGSIGTLRWDNAYGTGRNFEWSANPGLLKPVLEINSTLPTPPQFIIDGSNPMLSLSFIFAPSSSLDIYANGQLWDKSSTVQTVQAIEFRNGSESLWYFYPATCWASGLNWTPNYTWASPYSASGSGWVNPANAKDSNTVTFASRAVPALQWSDYLTLALNESRLCDKVRLWSDGGAQVNAVQVDVYYDGNWTNIYNGTLIKGSWQTYTIPAGNQTVSQARVRYWNSHASATRTAECHEFQFWASESPPSIGQTITTSLRKVGSDLWLDVLVPYKWLQTAVYPIYIDPDTGFHACGTAAQIAGAGTDWSNPTYAQVRDVTNLATNVIGASGISDYLRGTNFGFDADIPEGATIDGIIVRINRKASSTLYIADAYVYLWDGSAIIGNNKASTSWPSALTDKDYGTSSDKWGATLTAAMIRSSIFGVQIAADNSHETQGRTASVDVIEMCVYYTVPANPAITNSQNAWAMGIVQASDIRYFSVDNNQDDDYSLITNTGDCAVNVAIQGLDMEGGSYDWTLASAAGNQTYSLYANSGNGSSTYNTEVKKSSYSNLCSALAVGSTYKWSMKFTAPTAFNANEDGNQKSCTVTLVASAS